MPYPDITTNFSTLTDYKDRYRASHLNALQTAVNSIITAMPHKQQLVVVAKARGDYDNLASAVAAITDASASKPYAILVMPGVYTGTATCKSHVHIIGASCRGVKITQTGANTINMASNSSLSNLTIENLSTDPGDGVGVLANNTANVLIDDCEIITKQNISDTIGINVTGTTILRITNSFFNNSNMTCGAGTTVTLENVDIEYAYDAYPIIVNGAGIIYIHRCRVNTTGGEDALRLYNGAAGYVYNSYLHSDNWSGIIVHTNSVLRVKNSELTSNAYRGMTIVNSTDVRVEHCSIVAGGDNEGIKLDQTGGAAQIAIFNSLVKKSGSATVSINTTGAVNSAIAHCSLNAALHANLTNLIATPYNVMDTDV